MTTIHNSHFQRIDMAAGYFDITWQNTLEMTEREYREEVEAQLSLICSYYPYALLIDTRNFLFTIPPDIQEWTASYVIPNVSGAGVRKVATLLPADLFAQISIEQTFAEDKKQMLTYQYFEDREKAMAWCATH